jgi:hypothetical protein
MQVNYWSAIRDAVIHSLTANIGQFGLHCNSLVHFFEGRMFSRWIVTHITSARGTLHCCKTRILCGDQLVICGQYTMLREKEQQIVWTCLTTVFEKYISIVRNVSYMLVSTEVTSFSRSSHLYGTGNVTTITRTSNLSPFVHTAANMVHDKITQSSFRMCLFAGCEF